MHGDERDGQAAAITQFGQGRVGMVEHVQLKSLQQRAAKCRLAPGIRWFGINRAGIAIALDDILHRALGDSETLGDCPMDWPFCRRAATIRLRRSMDVGVMAIYHTS